MGDKILDAHANESEENSYRIITYKSKNFPQDLRPKIFANFLNSLRYGNDYFKLIDRDNYFSNYKKHIEYLLSKPSMSFKVATLKDDVVIGWSMFENNILHYVWVDKLQSRNGIGLSLIPENIDSFTHITNKGIGLWLKHFRDARFAPLG